MIEKVSTSTHCALTEEDQRIWNNLKMHTSAWGLFSFTRSGRSHHAENSDYALMLARTDAGRDGLRVL